jgi:hypothetical protein
VLTANSATATGLEWTTPASAGNVIINGAFDINQRGLTSSTASAYHFDRWRSLISSGTVTNSAQTFTAGESPAQGGRNFLRTVTSSQSGSGAFAINIQPIEDVRTFAGETVTVSFYARAGSGTPKLGLELFQVFGSGGSPSASVSAPAGTVTLSTSWARYSLTVAVPSLSGKTIGTNNNTSLDLNIWYSAGTDFNARTGSIGIQSNTFDIWGVQLEAGTVATPFRRNSPSIQAELAACQRYYFNSGFMELFHGFLVRTNDPFRRANPTFPVTLRRVPTVSDISVTWTSGTPGSDSFTTNQFRTYSQINDTTTEAHLRLFTVSVEF